MSQLDNVSLTLKANVYFDGGVISHTIQTHDGLRKTVGVIRPGKYHFNTEGPERMEILSGDCQVKLAGEKKWTDYGAGDAFHVSAKSSFDIQVKSGLTEYLCSFE